MPERSYLQLPITAMGCRQCLPLSVVLQKGKHCRNPIAVMGLWIHSGNLTLEFLDGSEVSSFKTRKSRGLPLS